MDLNQKKLNFNLSTKKFEIKEEQDVVTIEGYASKMYQDGKPVTDLDSEMVEVSKFRLEAKRLLLYHDLDEPVGDIELEHRPDGIYLKGKVYKDTMSDKEWARLKRGLLDFSIGFIAEEAEYRVIDGKEILVFTKGVVYEVSLVAIPSNKFSTLDVIKSVKSNSGIAMECSIENIKSMNPDMDCSCLSTLKDEAIEKQIKGEEMNKEKIKEVINKGLTFDETRNEFWNVSDTLFQNLSYFVQTLEENIYEFKWSESFDRNEMMANINQAMEIFRGILDEETLRIGEAIGKKFEGTKQVVTKEVGESEGTVEVTQTEVTPTETPVLETPTEVVVENSVTEDIVEITKTETTVEVSSSETTELKSEQNELANTFDLKQETIDILKADLNELPLEDMRNLYDSLAEKLDKLGALDAVQALQKIERYVEEELQSEKQ